MSDLTESKVARDSTRNIDMHKRRVINAADAVDLQDYVTLDQLNNQITSAIDSIPISTGSGTPGPPGPPGSSNIYIQNESVAGAPLTITPSHTAIDGAQLEIFIAQDGTGYAITWDSAFIYAPEVPTYPDTVSICLFLGKANGKWYCVSSLLGRHS